MGHRRSSSESVCAFTNPLKPKPAPKSLPHCFFTSCFSPDTSETSLFRPDPRRRSRFGRPRPHSADFRYDPLSYALNFDDGDADPATGHEFPYRHAFDRLPAPPPSNSGASSNAE